MKIIQRIIEPRRLWLVWQSNAVGSSRSRYLVGELVRDDISSSNVSFSYLHGTVDYEKAEKEGFLGFPAFKEKGSTYKQGVLEAFMRRLPPRHREDFKEYLLMHRLPKDFHYTDFALLGYTGAKLPSDGFEFCLDFGDAITPFELILEVAGFRHNSSMRPDELILNHEVQFILEPKNQVDSNAIAIFYDGQRIGYVGRTYAASFHDWIKKNYKFNATIERVNGKPERPLVYLFVKVSK